MLRDLQHAAPCVRVERHGDIRDAKKRWSDWIRLVRLVATKVFSTDQIAFSIASWATERCALWKPSEVLSVSPISLNAAAIRRRTREALENLACNTWLGVGCAAAVPQLFAVSFQPRAARESLAKAGLQPEETPRWHQRFVFSRMSPFRRINRLRIFQDVSFHAAELNHIQERHDDLRVPLKRWHSDGIVMNPRNQNESTILAASELTRSQVPAHAWERKRRLVARWGREDSGRVETDSWEFMSCVKLVSKFCKFCKLCNLCPLKVHYVYMLRWWLREVAAASLVLSLWTMVAKIAKAVSIFVISCHFSRSGGWLLPRIG